MDAIYIYEKVIAGAGGLPVGTGGGDITYVKWWY